MGEDLPDVILIEPEMIPEYLTGEGHAGSGVFVVKCEDIDVCRYTDGKLTHVACDHPRHGSHPKFASNYAKIKMLSERLKFIGYNDDGPCPKCDGKYWLDLSSPAAQQQVVMSLAFGMWRGIAYTARQLKPEDTSAMISAFLKISGSEGASSSSVGMAAPGRANFSTDAVTVGKEPGKGEDDEQG